VTAELTRCRLTRGSPVGPFDEQAQFAEIESAKISACSFSFDIGSDSETSVLRKLRQTDLYIKTIAGRQTSKRDLLSAIRDSVVVNFAHIHTLYSALIRAGFRNFLNFRFLKYIFSSQLENRLVFNYVFWLHFTSVKFPARTQIDDFFWRIIRIWSNQFVSGVCKCAEFAQNWLA